MFNFLKPKSKPQGSLATFKIEGMHCTSCSLNIDGELEDTPGVLSAQTSYAKAVTKVTFDPQKITPEKMITVIKKAGYTAQHAA